MKLTARSLTSHYGPSLIGALGLAYVSLIVLPFDNGVARFLIGVAAGAIGSALGRHVATRLRRDS
ncbi:hypothetical protein C9F11_42860 (plasmid) [Streptomyces sp. YIM 121038]|uniref:hypothetical protein n=1 Tax=Streptomyces sp. YIM 121038 TaxID=2136401 RepID=UPI001110A1FB|nr:hypothetical protein [Streptomyces sp. YIM 121038]QCX82152.1 hypothetical protein C9F11_42860 [Streptomyces sp. YIM 121038]